MVSMANLFEVCGYCDNLLRVSEVKDFAGAFNGLQIENSCVIRKIGAAVDANFAAIELAIERGVDLLFVHHGFFWSFPKSLVGHRYRLYKKIFDNNLAIYSAHLPLDCHDEIGNNVIMANKLGLNSIGKFGVFEGTAIGIVAEGGMHIDELSKRIAGVFHGVVNELKFGVDVPNKIGVLSGSGGNSIIDEAVKNGIDTIITGEIRYSTCSLAQELGINIFACGHYATEVFGVKALADIVSKKFAIDNEFIDVPFNL